MKFYDRIGSSFSSSAPITREGQSVSVEVIKEP